jgi:hypothetical protein
MNRGRRYNYGKQLRSDVYRYVKKHRLHKEWSGSKEELKEYLYDSLFSEDTVTGNGTGTYTKDASKAEIYLARNLDLLEQACNQFECTAEKVFQNGPEYADVAIRCYLLPQAIEQVVDKLHI